MLVWVDTETTGLNFDKDALLELGIVVSDDDLNPVATFSEVIKPAEMPDPSEIEEIVRDMHRNNGLWADVLEIGLPLHEVENNALRFLAEALPDTPAGVLPMCGSSVGFDREVLRRHMPLLHMFFNYRNIDVTSVKELMKMWNPAAIGEYDATKIESNHRAADDCIGSMRELAIYRRYGFVPKEQ